MIKAVFFDMYGTVARFDPPREEIQQQACHDFGLEVSPEGITRGYSVADDFFSQENARSPVARRPQEERRRFFGEYQRLILEGAGIQVDGELAARIFERVRQIPYSLALYDDVLPTMDALKQRDITLGLISNVRNDMTETCQRLGLLTYLDFIVTSQEVGSEKPHAPIFRAALARAGVRPREAMHVGDQYAADVKGAQGVGIKPVLVDRSGYWREITDCLKVRSLWELLEHL